MRSQAVTGFNILCNLAVDSKSQAQVIYMKTPACNNFTRREVFDPSLSREAIDKFHNMQHHPDNHNAWHPLKG
jgi:hypothetical protein